MSDKRIIISGHAEFEMQRRGIASSDVIQVVRRPAQVVPSRNAREIRQSLTGRGRFLLRVVVKETTMAYHVVTAYKTTKIAKYWIKQ
jgi:hypothetical protein